MPTIGEQTREAADRSQANRAFDHERQSDNAPQMSADKAAEATADPKRRASTIVAEAADKTMHMGVLQRNLSARPMHDLAHEVAGSLNPGIEGGESDLTEKDTLKTTTKAGKMALSMPLGAIALAAQHDHATRQEQEHRARIEADKPPVDHAPSYIDRIKTAYDEGVASTSNLATPTAQTPAANPAPQRRHRNSGMGIE
ncbi:hypothetical protein GCM10019059_36870 [Camelimonas fluminis]|uniref:SprA family protein n=1 Tax=Camelimonas fluminis TaxID=1576911 RepID=A0ABV7UJL1_9HYPH|nr:hypothetical protein [Camelimonas fluminis]GHE73928.1 hypothetical protein GCM10019059_36870 [Camelimonas fluminis]